MTRSGDYSRADSRRQRLPAILHWTNMDRETRLKRLRFRAWHRGTKEADLLIGGYCDRYSDGWDESEALWFEALLDEEDVEIMAWAIGTMAVPDRWRGPMMERMQVLDYIPIER